jgi:hypothetical protein
MSHKSGGSRWFPGTLLAILILAGLWRAIMAALLPAISRDGVTFCWYARDLGEQGLTYLRVPAAQQHPLFPTLILIVQRLASRLGAPDSPLTWQRSGQVVCWAAGMAVIGLTGAIAVRLVRRLELPLDHRAVALSAMLMASVLDLNMWLSSDVMSEQVHLAMYLAAALLLLKLESVPAAGGCGFLSGLAFLTRQEGFLPALAGLVTLAVAYRRQMTWQKRTVHMVALLAGFLICAVPYWSWIGRFSTKKDVLQWLRTPAAGVPSESTKLQLCAASDGAAPCRPAMVEERADANSRRHGTRPTYALAKLETFNLPWYALLPHAVYRLLRAGRVVIPLLAVLPLVNLRRRLLSPVLSGLTLCLVGHFSLVMVLLEQEGYLAPRHMLVVVMLLVPLAAMLLARMLNLLLQVGHPGLGGALVAVFMLPLAAYGLRVPNVKDRFLVDAAHWLTSRDPDIASQRLLSGSSPRRIAFYADMRWEFWPEQPEAYSALSNQIRGGGRGYFALEVGPGFEREGNRELLSKLRTDAELAPYLGQVHVRPGPDEGTRLHLIELRAASG